MKFFKLLNLWATYGPELEILLEKEQLKAQEEQKQKQQLVLALCTTHKGSTENTVSTDHCDYCRLAGHAQLAMDELELRTKYSHFRGYRIPKLLPRNRNA